MQQVLDTDNYIMDLDEANFNNNATIFRLYSAKEAFGYDECGLYTHYQNYCQLTEHFLKLGSS